MDDRRDLNPKLKEVVRMVREISRIYKMKMPEVGVYPSQEINAFATVDGIDLTEDENTKATGEPNSVSLLKFNPEKKKRGLLELFRTHPRLEERIERKDYQKTREYHFEEALIRYMLAWSEIPESEKLEETIKKTPMNDAKRN
ncbi:20274_t:CDS:2, partial [Racocetra persica]